MATEAKSMGLILLLAGAVALLLTSTTSGADKSHRGLVLSVVDDRRSTEPCEVRLVNFDSGEVLSTAHVGNTATGALSPDGELLAIVSRYPMAGVAQPRPRLELFSTTDLTPLKRGYLPVTTSVYKRIPNRVTMRFSRDGKEILLQRMDTHDAVLTRVKLELDEGGVFLVSGAPLRVPGARSVDFLRLEETRLTIAGNADGMIHVLDAQSRQRESELILDPLADVPAQLSSRHLTGVVITDDGRHAYYVPQQPGLPREMRHVGHLQRIDLATSPPKVLQRSSHAAPNLRARASTVSEIAGALIVAEQKYSETLQSPSPRVTFFHTLTLTPARQVELSVGDCDSLTVSADGTQLYAVDFGGMVSVVDVATWQERKTFTDVGVHPALVLALP